MDPLTKVKLINALSECEVQREVVEEVSGRSRYSGSAWILPGGLPMT